MQTFFRKYRILEYILFFTLLLGVVGFIHTVTPTAQAAIIPLPDATEYGSRTPGATISTEERGGVDAFARLASGLIGQVKNIVGAVAIMFLVYSGLRLVMAEGEEEVVKTQKRNILYIIIGLAVIMLADDIADILTVEKDTQAGRDVFLGNVKGIVKSSQLFDEKAQLITSFIKYIIGGVAVLYMIRSGAHLISSGESEEVVTKEKYNLIAASVGLIMIVIADTVINKVLYRIDKSKQYASGVEPSVSVKEGISEMVGATNLVVMISGAIGVLMLVVGAVVYATAGGEEERMNTGKRIVIGTFIGLAVIYGAYAIVNSIVSGSIETPA